MGKKKATCFQIAFLIQKVLSLEGSHLLLHLAIGNSSLADLADLYFLGIGFDLIECLHPSSLANRALTSSALWKFSYACSSVCF